MEKYQNKYRNGSVRLQGYDYGQNGAYFLTICTKGRAHYFGAVVNGEMQLNAVGQLAEKYWLEIPTHFPFVKLGNFVAMPNHTHGVLIIDKKEVEEQPDLPIEFSSEKGGITGDKNPMFHQNIARIIRWYKGRCTFEIRKVQPDFVWQPRFHDHIIRNAPSFKRIQQYINNNPSNWKDDRFWV